MLYDYCKIISQIKDPATRRYVEQFERYYYRELVGYQFFPSKDEHSIHLSKRVGDKGTQISLGIHFGKESATVSVEEVRWVTYLHKGKVCGRGQTSRKFNTIEFPRLFADPGFYNETMQIGLARFVQDIFEVDTIRFEMEPEEEKSLATS